MEQTLAVATMLGLVRNHPTDGTPEDLGGGAEVDGLMRGLGVHALTEEPQILHLLANESTREADLLASHYHHFLPIQQLFRQYRRQSPQHVVSCVHHHSPGADP